MQPDAKNTEFRLFLQRAIHSDKWVVRCICLSEKR